MTVLLTCGMNTQFHDYRKLSKLLQETGKVEKVELKTRHVWEDIRENAQKKKDCPYSDRNKNANKRICYPTELVDY